VNYTALKGKLFQVDRDGVRVGRVVAINAGPRKGLRSIRLASPRYEGSVNGVDRWSWRGPTYCVDARASHSPRAGVLFRGRIVPLEQFIQSKGARQA